MNSNRIEINNNVLNILSNTLSFITIKLNAKGINKNTRYFSNIFAVEEILKYGINDHIKLIANKVINDVTINVLWVRFFVIKNDKIA